jgi:hypothetical protein
MLIDRGPFATRPIPSIVRGAIEIDPALSLPT